MELSTLLVDTNIYSGFMKGDPEIKEILKQAAHLYFPFIVIGELLFGFKLGAKEKENQEQLNDFLFTNRTTVLYPNESTLECYASVAVELRKKGKPIPTNDIWIAAFARQFDYLLFSLDSDFQYVDGIKLISNRKA